MQDPTLEIEDWGVVPYVEAADRQLRIVEEVAAGGVDRIVFCTHPPVVTLGRGTKAGDLTTWQGETVEVSRGGRATYHGPNQIVIYPIINLTKARAGFPARDVHAYLRALEKAIVETLIEFGVQAEVRDGTEPNRLSALKDSVNGATELNAVSPLEKPIDEKPSFTGVWVGEKKIASIGIAVKKWVTYHGIALNFIRDPQAFVGINPCGFQSSIMTSLAEVADRLPTREEFQNSFAKILRTQLCRGQSRSI